MRADDPWTTDRIAILATMWANGATAAAIADRLGASRSAVLGMIFRLRHRAVDPATDERRSAGTSAKPAELKRRRPASQRAPQTSPKRQPKPPTPRGKSLLELTNTTCRWILEAGIKWMVSYLLSHTH
jgi:GcrA cell cycle regulator